MKPTPKIKIRLFALSLAVPLLALVLTTSCENVDSTDGSVIKIAPAYAKVTHKGNLIGFTASGWSDYTWEINPSTYGHLSSKRGKSVIYTVDEMPASTTDVILTATGYGTNSDTSSSNATGVVFATATIRHIPKQPKGTPLSTPADNNTSSNSNSNSNSNVPTP